MDLNDKDAKSSEWEGQFTGASPEAHMNDEPVDAGMPHSGEAGGPQSEEAHEDIAGAPEPPEQYVLPAVGSTADKTNEDDRLMAALAWLSMVILQVPIVSIVLLLADGNKSRRFQRFHAINSIAFWVAALIYEALAVVAFTVLVTISLGCLAVCLWVLFLLPHLAAIYYAIVAYGGKEINIPIISDLVRGQKWV